MRLNEYGFLFVNTFTKKEKRLNKPIPYIDGAYRLRYNGEAQLAMYFGECSVGGSSYKEATPGLTTVMICKVDIRKEMFTFGLKLLEQCRTPNENLISNIKKRIETLP